MKAGEALSETLREPPPPLLRLTSLTLTSLSSPSDIRAGSMDIAYFALLLTTLHQFHFIAKFNIIFPFDHEVDF